MELGDTKLKGTMWRNFFMEEWQHGRQHAGRIRRAGMDAYYVGMQYRYDMLIARYIAANQ